MGYFENGSCYILVLAIVLEDWEMGITDLSINLASVVCFYRLLTQAIGSKHPLLSGV